MKLRCILDGLVLNAEWLPQPGLVRAYDGREPFVLEALEARFYEIVTATPEELLALEASRYRLLRRAQDFQHLLG